MLTLYTSSSSENLVNQLISTIKQPLSTPFAQELFVIQNQGMERWLSQQIAQENKVWGNYQFLFIEAFFKQISQRITSDGYHARFDAKTMLWTLESLLGDLKEEVFKPLSQYLTGDNIPVKRYQLAKKLSELFEKYQIYRPELLEAWQQSDYQTQHNCEVWQQALWLKLTHTLQGQHQGSALQLIIAQLKNTAEGQLKYYLPERIIFFGINHLSPLYVDYLNALALHTQIHFYWLTALPLTTSTTHPLLLSLGQQGENFRQLIIQQKVIFQHQALSIPAFKAPNNLQQLQQDLLKPSPERQSLIFDDSISIHSCHSKMREIEVLKNLLINSLEKHSDLQLRDIVVVAPNIQDYTAFIDGVFDDIPHSISGRNLRLSNPLLDAFICFLQLTNSRFGWQEVLDLLERPIIYESFDLVETDIELIKYWLQETHVRWGISGEHKQQLGLPALTQNTWEASLERLLMGYAVIEDESFIDDILPFNQLEGSSAQALGGLNDFMQLLFQAHQQFLSSQFLTEWIHTLNDYVARLFVKAKPFEKQILQTLITDFAEHQPNNLSNLEPISLNVIIHALEANLKQEKSASGLLRGQLTFCSMDAIRGIPFKVIAVLGMNEGIFPNPEKAPTFDLIAHNPRLGDFSRREDERQQFLELLLLAKEQLIITYIGQSQKQNASIPPSVVISELLEVLEQNYQLQNIIIHHPLQAFSPQYFDGSNPKLFSYNQQHALTANTLKHKKQQQAAWWQGQISQTPEPLIEIKQLFDFFRNPQRYFVRRQLGVYFQGMNENIEEREPFAIEGLEKYAIQHQWIESLLKNSEMELKKLQAKGVWLSGSLAELEYQNQQTELKDFAEFIQAFNLGEPLEGLAIDTQFNNIRLIGKLHNRYQNGNLFYRFASLKGKDFFIALLHHCLINLFQPQNTYLIFAEKNKDGIRTAKSLCFQAEEIDEQFLITFLELYQRGLTQPNTWFTEAGLKYVQQAYKLQNSSRASMTELDAAVNVIKHDLEKEYEPELRQLYQHCDDLTQLFDTQFKSICNDLFLPLWSKIQ